MAIPQKTREKIIECYFTNPWSLGRIARYYGVPKTTVFNLVTAKKGEDPSFALMRYLVVNLDKRGTDVVRYSDALRISMLLNEHGIDLETGERIMEELLVACFQEHFPAAAAITTLKQLSNNEYGMRPMAFAIERSHEMQEFNILRERKKEEKISLAEFVKTNKMVRENYEYFASHPVQVTWIKMDEAESYKAKYEKLLKDNQLASNEKSIDSTKLKNLNRKLIRPVTEAKFLEILNDIRQNPAEYWYFFEEGITAPLFPELGVTE